MSLKGENAVLGKYKGTECPGRGNSHSKGPGAGKDKEEHEGQHSWKAEHWAGSHRGLWTTSQISIFILIIQSCRTILSSGAT